MNTPKLKISAHYQVVREIGQGGMSIVYEAMDQRLKRPVAIKVLHPFLAQQDEYRKRFLKETKTLSSWDHPNIVRIFDVANPSSNPEQLYIVTELLQGQTLRDFVTQNSLIELPELSAMIIWQIAQALEHAHQKGIIHRDLKPENIMVKSDGVLKLMDFGIASIGSDDALTQSGTLLGSLAHVAPEVVKGQKISFSTDIFSLSTIFYWLLTNRLPFNANSPHALLKSIVDDMPVRIQQISPYILDNLALIVEKGMNKDPLLRYQSAQAMAEHIEAALLEMGLNIDIKKMNEALKEPKIMLDDFKHNIFLAVEKKVSYYQKQNAETKALALLCRLDNSKRKPINFDLEIKPKNRFIIFDKISFIILILFFYSYSLKDITKYMPEQKPEAIPESLPVSIAMPVPAPTPTTVGVPVAEYAPSLIKTEAKNKLQSIAIIIWPFASVYQDGVQIASDTKSLKLDLAQGTYKLSFIHPYAASVEKILKIENIGEIINLNIILSKSKPAFLVVNTNLDADVAVAGQYKGQSENSKVRPIVIPIPDKTHALSAEVIIQRNGYKAQIKQVDFIAGNTSKIDILLEPKLE